MTLENQLDNVSVQRLRRYATYASVLVAFVLIIVKMIAFFMTDSVAMLSSLLDSTTDLLTALVTTYGVASALKPPDRDHRYGHGKAEPLAALFQAAFIIGSSVLLGYESLSRFYHPQEIQHALLGYGATLIAIVLTGILIAFQRYVVHRTQSIAIGADNIHYMGDMAINLAVAAAFSLYQLTGLSWFDPLFGIIIAAGLVTSAVSIVRHALNLLMDKELPDSDRAKIKTIVGAHKNVHGLHDLRTRTDGERIFIEFHLELDGEMTLRSAHKIDEALMEALQKEYPNADVLIHQDPAGLQEVRLDEKIVRGERG